MKLKKRAFIPPLIILLAILLAVLASMAAKPPEKKQQQKPAVMVEVKEMEARDMTFLVDSQGSATPKYSTTLLAEVSGQIVDVADKYNAGGFFKKGEMLLQIDPSDYEVAVQQARAQLLQAQAALEEEKARARVAEEEWSQFTEGEAPALGLRKPQLASALAALESAEANLAMAERNLERTTIKAPYDSVMRSKQADLGQFVGAGAQIATLFGTEVAEIRLPLSDLDVTYLNLPEESQTEPRVLLESQVSGVDAQWLGKLVRTEGVLDEASRVIYGVVQVEDPYNLKGQTHEEPLRFGRFVQAQIEGQQVSGVMEVPTYAINPDGTVWTVADGRKLQKKEIEVIRTQANTSIVSDGLEEGDLVVLTQLKNALNGMKIRLEGDPLPEQMETSANNEETVAANDNEQGE
ncbi:efflux transporter periplasmic adaptor subunit [Idiomarina piscisalsi]|uniref:Efflux transporter periplasmic adaptor subunit n=1 Tax=Idiomarina piscisalsi TaxID=1096243 RepID=A0ABM6LSE5_9GAMM|nr:efflux RND transporter periplasmic adaptor subunit [Idiomarina piscisalsi]ASG65463.1 efflux transporter periplasmic adaptor subunit [Idiomarina piscisalsi]